MLSISVLLIRRACYTSWLYWGSLYSELQSFMVYAHHDVQNTDAEVHMSNKLATPRWYTGKAYALISRDGCERVRAYFKNTSNWVQFLIERVCKLRSIRQLVKVIMDFNSGFMNTARFTARGRKQLCCFGAVVIIFWCVSTYVVMNLQ